MEQLVQIDKDIWWDSEKLEMRLYMQEGYTTDQIAVCPNKVDITLQKEGSPVSTYFSLPVTVDNKRVTLSRSKGVYGETIDIVARIQKSAVCAANAEELAG